MKFYYNLYISEVLQPKKKEILLKLENGKVQLNKYLIVLASNPKNHLDFLDSVMLQQKVFFEQDWFIIGIADGYSGALQLVEKITQDVYQETQDVNIRKYILEKQKEFEERNV